MQQVAAAADAGEIDLKTFHEVREIHGTQGVERVTIFDDRIAEAGVAVNNAVHFVDPSARVNPGHSTNLKVFEQE